METMESTEQTAVGIIEAGDRKRPMIESNQSKELGAGWFTKLQAEVLAAPAEGLGQFRAVLVSAPAPPVFRVVFRVIFQRFYRFFRSCTNIFVLL